MKLVSTMIFFFMSSFIFGVTSGYENKITIEEKSDIKYMCSRTLSIIIQLLRYHLTNINTNTLQIINPEISNVKMLTIPSVDFNTEKNMIAFHMSPKASIFNTTFYWVFTFGAIPISGYGIATIDINKFDFNVKYSEKALTSSIENIEWKVSQFIMKNNKIAELLRIPSKIKSILNDKLNTAMTPYINSKLLPSINEYLMTQYPKEKNLIFPFFDKSNVVEFKYSLESIKVEKDHVETKYGIAKDKENTNYETDANEFAVTYRYHSDIVRTTVNKVFTTFLKSFTIKNDNIPESSVFKLNSKQFARVIPDFYMAEGNHDIEVLGNSQGENINMIVENDRIKIENLNFHLLFQYEKEEKKEKKMKKLLEADITIIGYFVPKIHIKSNSNSGYLNFDWDKTEIRVIDIEKKEYKIVYKQGLISFVNSAFENWIKVDPKMGLLGSGIYLEYPVILDPTRSSASLIDNDSFIAKLYTNH